MPNTKVHPLTLYKLRETISGVPVDTPEHALRDGVAEMPEITATLAETEEFNAYLYTQSSDPKDPGWLQFLRQGFPELSFDPTSSHSAALLIRLKTDAREWFALTFGYGRFLLRRDSFMRRYGLQVALNSIFENDSLDISTPQQRLRQVDAKTVAENTLQTRIQSNRETAFDTFGFDVQQDLLGAVVGTPRSQNLWGSSIRGSDALYLRVPVSFPQLGQLCSDVLTYHSRTDYRIRFDWIDNLQAVYDIDLLLTLAEEVESVLAASSQAFELAPPEMVEWDQIARFRYSLDPSQTFDDLELDDYLALAQQAGTAFDTATLREQYVEALDDNDDVAYAWSIFECLDGELRLADQPYLLVAGDFFSIAASYQQELDGYVDTIPEWPEHLPNSTVEENEGPYNKRAAESSDEYLMLDKKTVKVDGKTSPIEICDILTRSGVFVHVKRKLGSGTLSHLFAQGSVSGDLLLTSREFREASIEKVLLAASERGFEGETAFPHFSADGVSPSGHQIVYAIVAKWKNRSLTEALPFFSKINLRRHAQDLRRMGYPVFHKRIQAN